MPDALTARLARQQIQERLARASTARTRRRASRHDLATRLRRAADRLDP